MRWLVTGAGGMLGTEFVRLLRAEGEKVTAASRADLDLTDPQACRPAVSSHDVVVNTAAWTDADEAERHEEKAFAVNTLGPAALARAASEAGARLVHVSTDYVFHEEPATGTERSDYDEDAPVHPRSAYGRTKAAGEWAVRSLCPDHLILRTAWLYGAHGSCFPRTILRRVRELGTVRVVDDQVGQPTWTLDVARLIFTLVRSSAPSGIYHATSSGRASWFEFAQAVVVSAGLDPDTVVPATTEEISRRAPRPPFSALGHAALERLAENGKDVAPIGDWRRRWERAASLFPVPSRPSGPGEFGPGQRFGNAYDPVSTHQATRVDAAAHPQQPHDGHHHQRCCGPELPPGDRAAHGTQGHEDR